MRALALGLILVGASSAHALTDNDLAHFCYERGAEKLQIQASAYGCVFEAADIRATSVDNRQDQASQYVIYRIAVQCSDGQKELSKLVQYTNGSCR